MTRLRYCATCWVLEGTKTFPEKLLEGIPLCRECYRTYAVKRHEHLKGLCGILHDGLPCPTDNPRFSHHAHTVATTTTTYKETSQ